MSTLPCPECRAPLEIDPACTVSEPYWPVNWVSYVNGVYRPLPRMERTVPAALCPACEFCIVIEGSS